ncbi:sugar ABC transporter permease [Hahella sp. CCB-MM4]|uniref:carbohydrate ABC transporter permease n=1 Tax=Hahella sp. (strain CCB-MM4) TaxID=1926491 RepID=UPI000B9AF17E|nr:carbohydrate ABC transporter permease [Hahella sp. CCB-MM4]OZG75436.1 sugar ABC transporter permease [Hahella sp. CCB-MM4]
MKGLSTSHSVVAPTAWSKRFAALVVVFYAVVALVPIVWIMLTGFKSPADSISYPPKFIPTLSEVEEKPGEYSPYYQMTLEGYVNLFTSRSRQSKEYLDSLPPPETWYDELVRSRQMVITGASNFSQRYGNSLIIGFGSTFMAIFLGTLAAYGFSRFKVPLKDDLLFFILSTRMMPPIAAAIPIFLMFRATGLADTHAGMVLLYTAVNMGLAVWLLHSFIDEIPREYEEAAMIDGYTRLQAFIKVVLPQATTGIAATAMLCLVFAWNEYAFALLLTSGSAQTAPPFIPTIIGEGGLDWPAVGAGTTLFLIPVMVFTILVRKHLLRGITFGALRK